MRVLDLFAGIGGFSLAAHWMGWETVAFVEKDQFCQKVLRKNFGDDILIYDDVRTFPGESFRGQIDLITGGFPCQPFSSAGKRKGSEDERHLWPAMLGIIKEVRPRFVVAENVYGLLNWSGGLVFEQVQTDLEIEGYEVWSGVLPACGIGAPHRRNRVWFVAHSPIVANRGGPQAVSGTNGRSMRHNVSQFSNADRIPHSGDATNTKRTISPSERRTPRRGRGELGCDSWRENWTEVAAKFCRMDDVVPNRVDRLKSLGNAVVPRLVLEIFKAIEQANEH